MTNRKQRRQLLAEKAAQQNLTVDQLILIIQLGGDVAEHSDERIQPMSFQKTDWGCELTLMSINAAYTVQLWKSTRRLTCICERYNAPAELIHASDDCVAGWESLRAKILRMEGVEVKTAKEFDICQINPKTMMKAI
jgi:hypothetical protein